MRRFQSAQGLPATGHCDEPTWLAVVEASWRLGDRSLQLQAPFLRGDDVIAVQTTLARLGFDSGRIDGIFGPSTARALGDFQRNCGLVDDGVCGPFTTRALEVNAARSGSGPGIATLRELSRLGAVSATLRDQRIVVGQFGGLGPLSHQLCSQLRQRGALVVATDHTDPSAHAAAANRHGAVVYLGFESSADAAACLAYYATAGFSSPGGAALAGQLARHLAGWSGADPQVEGRRLPVLRETSMTAVVVTLGPIQHVVDEAAAISDAVVGAVAAWTTAPLAVGS